MVTVSGSYLLFGAKRNKIVCSQVVHEGLDKVQTRVGELCHILDLRQPGLGNSTDGRGWESRAVSGQLAKR